MGVIEAGDEVRWRLKDLSKNGDAFCMAAGLWHTVDEACDEYIVVFPLKKIYRGSPVFSSILKNDNIRKTGEVEWE